MIRFSAQQMCFAVMAVACAWGLITATISNSSSLAPGVAGVACPNCDLNSPASFVCTTGGSETQLGMFTKICVGAETGQAGCENDARPVDTIATAFNLTTNDKHCGQCGNECTGATNKCVNGVCKCQVSIKCESDSSFCNPTQGRCVECSAGFGDCATDDNTGTPGDCESNLLVSTSNCGRCGNACPAGHSCVNGECGCGTTPGVCQVPNGICDGTRCVACASPTNDVLTCSTRSVFDISTYCNGINGFCDQCPPGTGDCTNLNVDKLPDNGTGADCETDFTKQFGHVNFCGNCLGSCNKHNSMTCCAGSCRCGRFTNITHPSTNDCDAASVCSTTEYCDEKLARCMPLDFGNEDCRGNAAAPDFDDVGGFQNQRYCNSCNRTIAQTNLINNTCPYDDALSCGVTGEKCRSGQVCKKGKCLCFNTLVNFFFTWEPFLDEDRDHDNKNSRFFKPASGCMESLLTSKLFGQLDRAEQTLLGFMDCMIKSQSVSHLEKSFTPANFSDEGFRQTVCPGGAGQCPKAYCDELSHNFTTINRADYCGTAIAAAAQLKYCAQNFVVAGETSGDLLCANEAMIQEVFVNRQDLTWLDMYNFLGCDEEPRDDMILHLDKNDRGSTFMYRYEAGLKLLGSASGFVASRFIVAIVALCVMLVVAF